MATTNRGALATSRPIVGRMAHARGRAFRPIAIGVLALALASMLGIALGTVAVSPAETIAILARQLFGIDLGVATTPGAEAIVWDIRVPRVLTAMVVGTGLAVAGATFQGLLRN